MDRVCHSRSDIASPAGAVHLRQIQATASTTLYTRESFGRVLGKTQTLANGDVVRITYGTGLFA